MFSQALPTITSRARSLWLAALVSLLACGVAAASAEASAPPVGEAVIASAGGTTIDTTSGSSVPLGTVSTRSSPSRHASSASRSALTLNSSAPTNAGPSRPASTATSAASQVGVPSLDDPVVGTPTRRRPESTSKAALAQIQSGGPIVAYSGTAAVTGHPTHTAVARPPAAHAYFGGGHARLSRPVTPASTTPAAAAALEINVRGIQVYISPTAVHRPAAPGSHAAPRVPTLIRQAGAPGTGFAGLLPTDPRPAPAPGGPANTLFGSASGSGGGSSLLGIDALFAIAVLIAAAGWRRRSLDLPVLTGQSALLSMALDRPG